jgi:hypothetical protein
VPVTFSGDTFRCAWRHWRCLKSSRGHSL